MSLGKNPLQDLQIAALKYHSEPQPGKIGTAITKPVTLAGLKLAYTPGVATPCMEINANNKNAYKYTSKGNQVAVISNGTAVLGLGNIGALAGKPVMEGKALLFKFLAGIDAIDIEVDLSNTEELISFIKAISCTFGGINLEDVAAPQCFEISKAVDAQIPIPYFHDDQYGTAVVLAAAVKNALKLVSKNIADIKIVFSGAGAAALACANFLEKIGAKTENFYIFDSQGLITKNRIVDQYKGRYAQTTQATIQEALVNADLFVGLSKGNVITETDIAKMAHDPIILAMANPIPEIMPDIAKQARPDAIVGSGRSDFANQVNNVLCFPFLFRGALDVLAEKITFDMQLACVDAIIEVAQEMGIDRENIMPSAFNPLLLYRASKAVAAAAIKNGIAHQSLPNDYHRYLDMLVYGQHFEADFAPVCDKEFAELAALMKEHQVNTQSAIKIRAIEYAEFAKLDEPCLIVTKTMRIGYKTESDVITSNMHKTIMAINEEELIGVVLNSELLFNKSQRIWFANKLCRE